MVEHECGWLVNTRNLIAKQIALFKLLDGDGKPLHGSRSVVGKTVTAIGKAAGVVVDERTKAGATVRKFASAHDLRWAFGQRWATKIKPTQLRELMRRFDQYHAGLLCRRRRRSDGRCTLGVRRHFSRHHACKQKKRRKKRRIFEYRREDLNLHALAGTGF